MKCSTCGEERRNRSYKGYTIAKCCKCEFERAKIAIDAERGLNYDFDKRHGGNRKSW